MAGFLFLIPVFAGAQQGALVKADTLTLRGSASTSARSIAKLNKYQPVKVLERKNEWARVRADGNEGWVLAEYLTRTGFVWIDHDKLNVRRGPGTEYAVIMNYGRHFPVWVVDLARNGWILVQDYEGDKGWVHPNLVELEPPYVITKLGKCNVRTGVGTEAAIAFTAERGVIFQVLEEKDGWLHVRHADGDEGWMSAKIVFGWLDADAQSTQSGSG